MNSELSPTDISNLGWPHPTAAGARRRLVLLGIVLLGFLLRGWAALRLPVDYDEPVYMEAGFHYAQAMRTGDWDSLIDYDENREHPALVKWLYGLVFMALGEEPEPLLAGLAGRLLSVLFGTLAVLALALLDPLAGGFLAVHTLAVKYTSQVYLEALPHLASLAAVLALHWAGFPRPYRDRWFWLSAVALGVTAASKFTYLPILFVVLYLAIWEKRTRWHHLLLYALAAVATFWLLNPTMWREPFARLFDSLSFHVHYSQGARVELAGLPWYQPLTWISRSPPSLWHPEVFFYPGLDGVIFLLALPGLYWSWRDRRWVVVWLVSGLAVLLLWQTKWPQYTLILTPALCLAASTTVSRIYRWVKEQETYWAWFEQMIPAPPLAFWIITALLVIAIGVGYTAATLQQTLGRMGWSHFTTQSTQLPSNNVHDILPGAGETMILATERGAAIWSPPATTDVPDEWLIFTMQNSDLPDNRVLAVVRDDGYRTGHVWFGTEAGLAGYDGNEWLVYRAEDLGLAEDRVYALALGSDGRLWVGTSSGAAVLNGQTWTSFTTATSGLVDNWVLSLAVEPSPDGDRVWFGTRGGISRLDTATGRWTQSDHGFETGVADLLLDSTGRLWVGTLGSGLALWDGVEWQNYRTGNSEIPFNTVNVIAEVEPGVLWVGTSAPAEVGGVLAEFDGQDWQVYTPRNSGFSGAEPLAITQDSEGRIWIGTRTSGVDIFQAEH